MGQILIEPTARLTPPPTTSVFDPSTQPALGGMRVERFSSLRFQGRAATGNVGGRWALPMEFDASKFAASFVEKGQGILAAQMDQPVLGTGFVADGWQIWKYPEKQMLQKVDDKGQPVFEEKRNPAWSEQNKGVAKNLTLPVFEDHPLAGKSYEVPSLDAHGATYVLMFRPLIVQRQVNEAYGALSIDNMAAEVRGDTIGGAPIDDRGMLPDPRLAHAHIDHDIAADREAEAHLGRSSVVQSTLSNTTRLTPPPQTLSR